MREKPSGVAATARRAGDQLGAFASCFALTIANPATIVSFLGIVAGGIGSAASIATAARFALGVTIGSAVWWLLLTSVVGRVRGAIGPRSMRAINIAAGLLFLAFGVATSVRAWSSIPPP